MADKKKAPKAKAMAKKDMKKTKGGLNFTKAQTVQQDIHFSVNGGGTLVQPGQISSCDGSV